MVKALPALLVGALALGAGIWGYNRYQQDIGARNAAIRVLADRIDSLHAHAHTTDSVYLVRVDTLWRRKAVYDTIRDTLLKNIRDTVIVKEYVHIADSTIAACTQVVSSCQLKVAQRDSLIGLQASQLRILRQPPRLFGLLPAPSRGLVFGLGAVAGYLLHR